MSTLCTSALWRQAIEMRTAKTFFLEGVVLVTDKPIMWTTKHWMEQKTWNPCTVQLNGNEFIIWSNFPLNIRAKVTLVARPLLTPLARIHWEQNTCSVSNITSRRDRLLLFVKNFGTRILKRTWAKWTVIYLLFMKSNEFTGRKYSTWRYINVNFWQTGWPGMGTPTTNPTISMAPIQVLRLVDIQGWGGVVLQSHVSIWAGEEHLKKWSCRICRR